MEGLVTLIFLKIKSSNLGFFFKKLYISKFKASMTSVIIGIFQGPVILPFLKV